MLALSEISQPDDALWFGVFKSMKAEELMLTNMPEEQWDMLMRIQFRAQQLSYRSRYPSADHRIIRIDDEEAGYLITDRQEDTVSLVFIALLTRFRNQGYGTSVLDRLQETASIIRLQVAEHSHARRWYRKLGFMEQAHSPPYVAMQWHRQ